MEKKFSSRERMLMTLENKEADYVPCSFMIFRALNERCKDQFEFIERQIELGLDARVELPKLPIRFHPEVRIKEWKEVSKGEKYPILHKEYLTPAGRLTTMIRKTEDWPYGDHIPLFDDYLIPRSKKFLVTCRDDLKELRFLFSEPTMDDISNFREQTGRLKKLAQAKGLLISGGWKSDISAGTMGADATMWLCGMEKTILLAMDEPEFIKELLQIISTWNMRRMEIYLEENIDLLVRRAWYESTDLWSPSLYREFLFPILKREIKLVHQAGTKFGYIMTSGVMPLLDDFLKLGIDVLIGVDPIQGKETALKILKEKVRGKICLWGGVNGFVTIERGKRDEVRKAVYKAISILGPGGGFILSPVDNVRDGSEHTWDNIRTMIKTWRNLRNLSKLEQVPP
ncbi:hypothetical protein E3J84_01400 [Candidatus Aerophobetes bacterium]|uniref:Uroporphyrinogen decarboxylase (URO-D) domain-containing protein n=1 Tax=Aerophobetes bacterium TaxID=2030807 RepID=A0A523S3E2_UNCAE|nr:MAG: hypothetical protein E3J84_01400 [Candidatus Aerophobetes bacterium]